MAQKINLPKQDPEKVSPLNLAFIGDSVYEVVIRNKVLNDFNGSLNEVNKMAKHYAMAQTQSKIMHLIENELSEKEIQIFKRGRNAKGVSAPKSCTISEYREATGFESLIGYLYLKNNSDRVIELVYKGIELLEADENVG